MKSLADSTDQYFGPQTVEVDTTGFDSLRAAGGIPKMEGEDDESSGNGPSIAPVSRFNRAEGSVVGAVAKWSGPGWPEVLASGAYGFANKEGRYQGRVTRTLLRSHPSSESQAPSSLRLQGRYARETLPFAPEHVQFIASEIGALTTGLDRQSVFERRTAEGSLQWTRGSRLAGSLGGRDGRDQSMPRRTKWSLWGASTRVPEVTEATKERYAEGFGSIVYRRGVEDTNAGIEAQLRDDDDWRVRLGLAQTIRLGHWIEARTRLEYGATNEAAAPQLRFELGGPSAVPSLGFGDAAGARLALVRFDLLEAHDALAMLHVPHPRFLVFQPAIFAHAGAAWGGSSDPHATPVAAFFDAPPDAEWKGAAGVALTWHPASGGFDNRWRIQMAWPIGNDAGVPRASLAISR